MTSSSDTNREVGQTKITGQARVTLPASLPLSPESKQSLPKWAAPALTQEEPLGDGASLSVPRFTGSFSPSPSLHSSSSSKLPIPSGANLGLNVEEPQGEAGSSAAAPSANTQVPDLTATVELLAELQTRRKFYISVTNKQTNAIKALVRRAIGWRYDEDEAAREKTNARASRIVAAALSGKEIKLEDLAIYESLASDLAVVASALTPYTAARNEIEKEMKRAARSLPVYAWAKGVHGFGELGLAVIVAESGNLSNYPKKGHLWKRLGLAPYNGKAPSTWRFEGGLTADDWVELGYSPRRRAELYAVIGDPLFRQQSVVSGPYRGVYDRRRARTLETHPDWTKGHSHNDALRIMTSHLVRDLWVAWRRSTNILAA